MGNAEVSRPLAWMVDVDGTLALNTGRNPYDWLAAGDDQPNLAVVTASQALAAHPNVAAIIVISGREERARDITADWLKAAGVPFDLLLMRSSGDYRSDETVKEELFRRHVEPSYSVIGVLDDRDRVVQMWRRLGLVCFQVADGSF
jgi:altronate dehydratase